MAATAPRPRRPLRQTLLPVLLLVLTALLLALGIWQLQRRSWKLDLIARVESRVHAPATPAPTRAEWSSFDARREEYRHVHLQGTWRHTRSAWVATATELGSGYWLMTPLQQTDGSFVWVNRGYVSPTSRRQWHWGPDSAADVTGLLRPSETGTRWLRHNDPSAERWYARDVQTLSTHRQLTPTAPYFVDADASPGQTAEPVGGLTTVHFANNHLLYALCWFSLAGLAAWGAQLVWRSRPQNISGNGNSDNRQHD